jgi:predicted ATP-grasp superfamily ATP-dependent carboligase
LFPAPPSDLPRQLAGKYSLHELCKQWGFPHVRAALPNSLAEAKLFAEEVGLPLVAKLARPWQSGAIRSTTIVNSVAQLAELYRLAPSDGLMLQEYIPGGPGRDWFFHGYCDARSVCEPAFTGVKERSYPPHSGLTSFGRAAANPRLREQVSELLRQIGYRGIMDLDIRFDARDEQYKLLDFNPRIGAQFRIFENVAGIDVARAAHLDLTGRPIPGGSVMADRRFVVENYDSLAALGYMRRGELGLRSWLATLRRVDETAWFARDDMVPFGLMCVRMAWRAVERPFGGRRAKPPGSARFKAGRAARRSARHALHMRSDVPSRSAGLVKEEKQS